MEHGQEDVSEPQAMQTFCLFQPAEQGSGLPMIRMVLMNYTKIGKGNADCETRGLDASIVAIERNGQLRAETTGAVKCSQERDCDAKIVRPKGIGRMCRAPSC